MKSLRECSSIKEIKEWAWKNCKREWLIVKEFVIDWNWFVIHALEDDEDEPEAEKDGMVLKKRIKVNSRDRYKRHSTKVNLCKYVPRYKKQIHLWRDVHRIKYREHPSR